MRGSPVCAPKSPADSVVGDVSPRASRYDSLSTSKLRHTATRAPFGHAVGISLRPARAVPAARRSSSSVHRAPGFGGLDCATDEALLITQAAARQAARANARRFIASLPLRMAIYGLPGAAARRTRRSRDLSDRFDASAPDGCAPHARER